jgi:hypothetical protein
LGDSRTHNGKVTTDGAGGRGEGVGGAEDGWKRDLLADNPEKFTGVGERLLRPVLTASRPSQTMATMGPLSMSRGTISFRYPEML